MWHELPGGRFGPYDLNETDLSSTVVDPPKHRLAVDEDQGESNLGAVSFNTRRSTGRHDEHAYLMGRLTADRRGGAIYLGCRPPGEQNVREVLYIDNNGARFNVPIIGAQSQRVTRFYTDDGRFCFHAQGPASGQPNGALIKYDTHHSLDEQSWTPMAIIRGEAIR
jgi:hypothetical protein